MSQSLDNLISAHKDYVKQHFKPTLSPLHQALITGQSPQVMCLACSDSRIDPAVLFQAQAGNIFSCRNVANLIPAYQKADNQQGNEHGTLAAIEYGICHLKVKDFILLGHTHCGGITTLMNQTLANSTNSFIPPWLAIAEPVRQQVLHDMPTASLAEQTAQCNTASLQQSLTNLLTYPWVEQRVVQGLLRLHAWQFDIETGELHQY